jgi:sugar/nucleoside kinase (ribokinase family)
VRPPKVVCLGVHLLDVLVRPSQEPDFKAGWQQLDDLRITAAGTAAGPAVDLAKLGAEVISIGVIGDDYEGGLVADLEAKHGVDTSRLLRAEGAPTHVSLLFIGPDGERNPIMIRPGTMDRLAFDDIDFEAIASADVLHIGGADMLGEFAAEPLVEVMRFAREKGVVTTLDVLAKCEGEMVDHLAPALRQAQFFFPNEGQLAQMTGTDDPATGVARMRELGVETVVGTLGEHGSLISGPAGDAHVPAYEIDLVDTTGCGDAYVSGFIVGIANGWDPAAAGWLGSAASGLVATGLGSDAGIVDLPTTLDFMMTAAPPEVVARARSAIA